jgi:predicted ATP-dependent endonuclease of OLD family
MIASLHLRQFKRFESLDISGLSKVNLISGKNNCGKTGLLEAILLAGSHWSGDHIATRFRLVSEGSAAQMKVTSSGEYAHWFGRQQGNNWAVWTHGQNLNGRAVEIDFAELQKLGSKAGLEPQLIGGDGHRSYGKPIDYVAIRSWPYSIDEDLVAYESMLKNDGTEQKFESLLRVLEPKLQTIRSLPTDSKVRRALYANTGLGKAIPLALLGNGVNRLSAIYSRALGAKASILLIDEIENGLHHGALIELWKGLKELSDKEGTQIFATTHSMECIAAASEVFGAKPASALSFHRIEDVNGVPSAISIDAALLAGILEDGFEIR